ncbi:tyrosine--tRNA ligase [Marinisporobacter balticus]|uniref:Tyrosine--tRNA ligase n=1 Tax=Marinisporobacter balticus TaxID=2018667 RepID=A0A4R2KW10_9FIRM|nr:tyrosine--tRNA ligase [Marinisporobacter balticus]TCO74418.1 tyrosyl-tRNA synthetase [Marinisporobacter balticus]
MTNVFDVLKERGFIQQTTHEDEIRELLGKESVSFYIGFDPTADSLHVGHFLQVITMMHMQRAGHRPIVLVGGGTGMVGDPTGKTDMRKMMTPETIASNCKCFKKQLSRFLDFSDGKAIMANNADWLMNLEYIPFLREIGRHFSVNRMLTAECFKSRMEQGLSFLEFNYMIMQSYDFLELHRKYNCKLQLGGDDQWSNIINGADLIRRVDGESAYGMTFTLLTTSEGKKMGKTESGALWLDPEKTSPYEFYQYWRNVADADVERCLSLLTFLPMDEVRRFGALKDAEINQAKEILAYEVTKLVHGQEEAQKSQEAAKALFGKGPASENVPSTEISRTEFIEGMDIMDLLTKTNLIPSRSEGRRLIQQGGLSIDGEKITDLKHKIQEADFKEGTLMIKKGKKIYHQVKLV